MPSAADPDNTGGSRSANDNKWQVVWQYMPFAHTQPSILIVEAATPEAAYATAFVELTNRGNLMDSDLAYRPSGRYGGQGVVFNEAQQAVLIREYKIPVRQIGNARILKVELFEAGMRQTPGKVLQG